MDARRKCSSCADESGFTSGNCPGIVTLNQYLIQRQRLQVESPKVKSDGAIVSRAGFSGLTIFGAVDELMY
jgi:hypothetical protein